MLAGWLAAAAGVEVPAAGPLALAIGDVGAPAAIGVPYAADAEAVVSRCTTVSGSGSRSPRRRTWSSPAGTTSAGNRATPWPSTFPTRPS